MRKCLFVLFLISLMWIQTAGAATRESEFAMFKRTIAPVYKWGENGVLTIPKAEPAGRYDLYVGSNIQDAGKVQDESLYLTTNTIMLGTSSDVELGYTKRFFIWSDFKRADVDMDTLHLKARVLHLSDVFLPQVAVGVNAAKISGKTDISSQGDVLFNPYATVTINIPIVNRDYAMLSLTGTVESTYNQGASSDPFFSVGADLRLFNHLYLMAECQGLNIKNQSQVINAGIKYKIWWLEFGIAGYNIAGNSISTGEANLETKNAYLMGHMLLEIPFDKIFSKSSANQDVVKAAPETGKAPQDVGNVAPDMGKEVKQ